MLFYGMHILGMAWSNDFHYGLNDLKSKLPLIIFPFVIASSPALEMKKLRFILSAFIAGTMIASFATVLALLGAVKMDPSDFRNASLFVDHIRFSLMVVLSIVFAAYLFVKKDHAAPRYYRWLYLIAFLWLPVFLFVLKSLSGIVIMAVVILFIAIHFAQRVPDRAIRFMLNVFIIFIPLFSIIYIGSAVDKFYRTDRISPESLDKYSVRGNPYINNINSKEIENGHYVWIYVCPEELEEAWARVSDIGYQDLAENGDPIKYVLIRYLTSKGLRKDANGVEQLTPEDIDAIESGIANHIYLRKFALYPRIYEAIWEFDRYHLGYDANDKSLVQRYYYFRAGLHIAGKHLLTGVGTGDVRSSFEKYYEKVDSPLRPERRRRAHNQYLTLIIALGIPGFIICTLAFLLPVFVRKRWKSFMAIIFLLIMGLSMLNEDTLESTTGVVIFGLFYGLFIFGKNWEWGKYA